MMQRGGTSRSRVLPSNESVLTVARLLELRPGRKDCVPESAPRGTTTGSMPSMAKSKLSVSLDPDRLERAQELVHAGSVSELLDIALTRMIEQEVERRHIEGYIRIPPDNEFAQWAVASRSNDDDEVDWAALYGLRR